VYISRVIISHQLKGINISRAILSSCDDYGIPYDIEQCDSVGDYKVVWLPNAITDVFESNRDNSECNK
jgi:hypothetical protein